MWQPMSNVSHSIAIAPTCAEVSNFYWHTFLHLSIFMETLTLTFHLKVISLYIACLKLYGFCISSDLLVHFNNLSNEICYIQGWYHYLHLSLAARMFIKLKSCIISLILCVFHRHSLFKPRHFGMHSTTWKSLCRGTQHNRLLCTPTHLKTEVGPTFET